MSLASLSLYPKQNIKNYNVNHIKDESKSDEDKKGSVSGDASAEEDALIQELAMISNAEAASLAASKSNEDILDEEASEERDAFEVDIPSPLSTNSNVVRPIPMLAPSGPGSRIIVQSQHPRLTALQTDLEPSSLKLPSNTTPSSGMSRSISDSTLRRAALHLNLNQNSVLPSFTSLQQFKVFQFFSGKIRAKSLKKA